jgi:hypothetical protein
VLTALVPGAWLLKTEEQMDNEMLYYQTLKLFADNGLLLIDTGEALLPCTIQVRRQQVNGQPVTSFVAVPRHQENEQ